MTRDVLMPVIARRDRSNGGLSLPGPARTDVLATLAVISVLTLSAIVFAPLPVLFIGAACLLAMAGVRPEIPAYILASGVIVAFSWVNVGKASAGDWVWYSSHYGYLEYTGLSDYLGMKVGVIRPEVTEPVYYAIAMYLSRFTGADTSVLAVVVTICVYLPVAIASIMFARSMSRSPMVISIATLGAMMMGLTFTLSTQLVRQEIAAGLLCVAIVLAGLRRGLWAAALLALSCLTHNSALVPAVGVVVVVLLAPRISHVLACMAALLTGFYILGFFYLRRLGAVSYVGESDGSVSAYVILADVLLAIVFLAVVHMSGHFKSSGVVRIVSLLLPCLYGFVLALQSEPIPFLRMYFFIEILRALMLCYLFVRVLVSRWAAVSAVCVCLVAIVYVQLRMSSSPFEYERDLVSVLVWSPF